MGKDRELLEALEREFGLVQEAAIADEDWREDPLPFAQFAKEHLRVELWPMQQVDFEAFLGSTVEDTKRLFTQDPPTPYNCAALAYGKGCIGAHEKIVDYASGEMKTAREWAALGRSLTVLSIKGDRLVLAQSSPVYLKGTDLLYKVTLDNGQSFIATGQHRCLSLEGWQRVSDFQVGRSSLLTTLPYSSAQTGGLQPCSWGDGVEQSQPALLEHFCPLRSGRSQPGRCHDSSNSVHLYSACCEGCNGSCLLRTDSPSTHADGVHCGKKIVQDFRDGCRLSAHSYDGLLPSAAECVQEFSPSQADALLHNLKSLREGGLEHESVCSQIYRQLSLAFGILRHTAVSQPPSFASDLSRRYAAKETFERSPLNPTTPQHRAASSLDRSRVSPPQLCLNYSKVKSVEAIGVDSFYDLTVPVTHCYFGANGVLHSNSGKDLVSSMAMAWFIHILLCMNHPQRFLGLEESEAIDIALASPTLRQTRRITFTKFKNRLRSWEWLRSLLPELGIQNPDRYLKQATEAADFVELPHNIRIHNLPLNSSSAEGFNMLAFILSEFAGLDTEAAAASATDVFQSFVSSGRTRYQKAWKGFLASFPRSLNDPQEKLIEAQGRGLFPELYVVRRPTWEVHPGRTFEDFANDFARNPEDSWAKYGAQPRAATDAYFRSPELILLHASGAPLALVQERLPALDPGHQEAIANAGLDPILEVNYFGDPVLDGYGFPQLAYWFRGQRSPSGEPYEYYVHLDPGKSGDAYGFAMGHIELLPGGGLQPVIDLSFRWTGSMFYEFGEIIRKPWFDDTMEQREIISAAEVDFRTIREFLFFLKCDRGFNIETISMDTWNSVENIQELRKRGFYVVERIVSKEDYDEFKGLVYNRQLRYYARRIVVEESYKLQILNGQKVEAPRTKEGDSTRSDSHKDVTDAIAAVCRRMVLMLDAGFSFAELPENQVKQGAIAPIKEAPANLSDNQQELMRLLDS